jgi:hypothetical protein
LDKAKVNGKAITSRYPGNGRGIRGGLKMRFESGLVKERRQLRRFLRGGEGGNDGCEIDLPAAAFKQIR